MNTRRAAMSEQPATTSRVKAGFCGSPASPIFPLLAERFDRWLDRVRAEAWEEAVASAYLHETQHFISIKHDPNPYRQEADL